MGNYSESEIAAFGRKDLLNSRMSAVKATSVNFEGKAVDVVAFKEFSDKVFDWIRQDQLESIPEPEVKGTDVLPVPTAEQKKVLDAILNQVRGCGPCGMDMGMDMGNVKLAALEYSTMVAGLKVATYPKSMDSVGNIVNYIKGDDLWVN